MLLYMTIGTVQICGHFIELTSYFVQSFFTPCRWFHYYDYGFVPPLDVELPELGEDELGGLVVAPDVSDGLELLDPDVPLELELELGDEGVVLGVVGLAGGVGEAGSVALGAAEGVALGDVLGGVLGDVEPVPEVLEPIVPVAPEAGADEVPPGPESAERFSHAVRATLTRATARAILETFMIAFITVPFT